MSATSNPFGLRPAYHGGGGVVRPVQRTIVTGYATNIFLNQPVKIGTNGTVEAAAIGDRFIGVFQGVEYTDVDGRRRVSNKWTASTTATDIVAYVTQDPQIVYEIQSNAALTLANIGEQYNFTTIGTGSTVVGISQMMLDVSSTGANKSLQFLGASPYADNAYGDAFVIAQVRISQHQLVADVAAF